MNVNLNGHDVTREDVKKYLTAKRVSLWSDWCITHPDRMELAVDWFLNEIGNLSSSVTV